jgi:hypothetical protein
MERQEDGRFLLGFYKFTGYNFCLWNMTMKHFTSVRNSLSLSTVSSVYAVAVMFIYGWTIYWFLWNFPSWIYYLSFFEILSVAAYALAANLLESLILLGIPVLAAFLLPVRWFSERFIPAGVLSVAFMGALLIYFAPYFQAQSQFSYLPFMIAPVALLISIVVAALLARVEPVARLLSLFAERARIFIYLSIPLSIISVIVVLIQNLN